MAEKIAPRELRHPVNFLALGFGSGLVPVAPGTAGTLAAIPVYLLLQPLAPELYLPLVALLFVVGIPICAFTAKRLGVHDHPGIVWDEVVGYLVTMAFAPAHWLWVVAGFVLFRIFDVAKPWPIKWLDQQVHGGLGIMLDDLVAGVFAAVLLQLLVVYV